MNGILSLTLCIVCTCILLTGLRQIGKYKVDLPLFVGINYLSATLTGLISFPNAFAHVFAHPILAILATVQGASFFGLFYIMGWLSHKVGLGYMTIVAKMSLAIPVLFSWLYYGDRMTIYHFAGMAMALTAIFLVNLGEKEQVSHPKTRRETWMMVIITAILFIGSGASDALFKVLDHDFKGLTDSREYIIVLFAAAALTSLPIFIYKALNNKLSLNAHTVLSGLIMGIPNYFSIVFLAGSLQYFDGTVFYPINNTAILLIMAVVGILIYRERLNTWKAIGLVLAMAAVVMLGAF
jgi:drug/metabolite transporter (DMT)-like permease